jgi:hypothetical protein
MAFTYKKPNIPDFRKVTRKFAEIASGALTKAAEKFAKDEAKLFRQEITDQIFPAFRRYPLSEEYLYRKKRAGADERVMLATHWYRDHIKVWPMADPKGRRNVRWIRIGFHHAVQARNLKGEVVPILLDLVAKVHEFGSEKLNIPPRAHWVPHRTAMRRRAKKLRDRIRAETMRLVGLRMRRFA